MRSHAICGVWPTARRWVTVIVRDGRAGNVASVARAPDACWGFVTWLAASGVEVLVTTEALAEDELIMRAREEGLEVWLAPVALVDAVRAAAAITRRPAKQSAALLARWPTQPVLRQHLRRAGAGCEERQLQMW